MTLMGRDGAAGRLVLIWGGVRRNSTPDDRSEARVDEDGDDEALHVKIVPQGPAE